MSNFLAAGTSLEKFITLSVTGIKFPFPYEWFDSFDKLNETKLPAYENWYSSLKMKNIHIEEYQLALKIWNENIQRLLEVL